MDATDSTWRASTSIYRALVLGQTIAWAVGTVSIKTDVGTRRGTVILTWACFQAAGLLAWLGYISSGEGICFAAGVMSLVLMHAFGPGRLRNTGERAA